MRRPNVPHVEFSLAKENSPRVTLGHHRTGWLSIKALSPEDLMWNGANDETVRTSANHSCDSGRWSLRDQRVVRTICGIAQREALVVAPTARVLAHSVTNRRDRSRFDRFAQTDVGALGLAPHGKGSAVTPQKRAAVLAAN